MNRPTLSLATLSLLIHFTVLTAQQPPPIEAGQRVRVTAPDCGVRKQVTTSEALRGDALILDLTQCPLASVTRLDVHRGRHGHPWRGAVVGIFTGYLVGTVIGDVTRQCELEYRATSKHWFWDPPRELCTTDMSTASQIAMYGGAAVGVLVGALIKTDRWEEIPVDRLKVGFAPQRDGSFVFGVRYRF